MGSYEDVYLPFAQPFGNVAHLCGCFQTADKLYVAWKVVEPGLESMIVLQRQDGRGNQNRHLFGQRYDYILV